MRMHKKARLEERLAACSAIYTAADISQKNMALSAQIPAYIGWNRIFDNDNPICLEVGCGKGKFIAETALNHPELNFVAVEKISNVLIEAMERIIDMGVKNVYFLNCAAEVLPRYFKEGEVSKIYLNFSNPLPKEGYKKQRLTHPKFLQIYSRLLKDGGQIVQKTDNRDFYLFSKQNYQDCGYRIEYFSEDYSVEGDDVETEHEKKFRQMGRNIYKIVAVKQ